MKSIGILGYGWLGTNLAKQLLALGYLVKGTTTTPEKLTQLQEQGLTTYQLNLQDQSIDQLDDFLEGLNLLIITIPPFRGETTPTYKKNFDLLLPYLHKHNINKVIMMSSVSVYAAQKELITETNTVYAVEPTAQQIVTAEQTLLQDKKLFPCILRLGGLFGPDRHPVKYICSRDVFDNPNLPINMIHLQDIINYTLAIIKQNWNEPTIYNLVSPLHESRRAYYENQAKELGLELPPLGKDDDTTYRKVDGTKIAQHTNIDYTF